MISGTRKSLFKLHGGICAWCGCPTRLHGPSSGNLATVDHLFPRTDYRRHTLAPQPKVLACYSCNHIRGSTYLEYFLIACTVAWRRFKGLTDVPE